MPERRALPPLDVDLLRGMVESAPDALLVIDERGAIAFANATAVELLGYPRDRLIGAGVELLLPPELKRAHARHRSGFRSDALARPMGPDRDLALLRADGTELPIDIRLAPLTLAGRRLVLAAVRDATERREAERVHRELLARLERRRERERLAGDIHDDLIQSVYAVGLDLQAARADPSLSKDEALNRAVAELKSVIGDLRAYLEYLRDPRPQDDQAVLTVRLRSLLRSHGGVPRWTANITLDEPLREPLGRELYLIVKELVSNVARHANAAEASVALSGADGRIELRVEDDGVGFDEREVGAGAFGLSNLRQRVLALGGTVAVESTPSAGTVVRVHLPMSRPARPAARRARS